MVNKCNCRNCTNRFVGCHSFCEDYKRYRDNLDTYNEEVRKLTHGSKDNYYRVRQSIEKHRRGHR